VCLLVASPDEEVPSFSREHYKSIKRKYFSVLCLAMIWVISLDPLLGPGITLDNAWDMVLLALFGLLAITPNKRVHGVVTVLAVIFTVGLFALRGTGVVG